MKIDSAEDCIIFKDKKLFYSIPQNKSCEEHRINMLEFIDESSNRFNVQSISSIENEDDELITFDDEND